MARNVINNLNRKVSILTTKLEGGGSIELLYDKYDNVIYIVDENGNYKKTQLTDYELSPLPSGNSIGAKFSTPTRIECRLGSPVFIMDFAITQISITYPIDDENFGTLPIDSYQIIENDKYPNSFVNFFLDVNSAEPGGLYSMVLNLTNVIGETNLLRTDILAPSYESYETIVNTSKGIFGDICSGEYSNGLTYVDEGSFKILVSDWLNLYAILQSGIEDTQTIDLYIKPTINDNENVDALTGFLESIDFSFIVKLMDETEVTLTKADCISTNEYNGGIDFIFELPAQIRISDLPATLIIEESWTNMNPYHYLKFMLFDSNFAPLVPDYVILNNKFLQLENYCPGGRRIDSGQISIEPNTPGGV